jgi:hypothetical protein
MKRVLGVVLLVGSASAAWAQKAPPAPVPGVDEVKVQQAIDKGVAFLRGAPSPAHNESFRNSDELVLWTFIHAGVSPEDPKFKALLRSALSQPLDRTYKVALLAMCLEELDRVGYQEKIAHCAQFFVDNQCQNGQWGYGQATPFIKEVKVPTASRPVASGGGRAELSKDGKPKVLQHVAVKKMKDGPAEGDNSNTQYAVLGLRACFDAGVMLPEPVVVLAVKWWRESQFADPKKDKDGKPVRLDVPSGLSGKIEGWNYKTEAAQDRPPYHAMTAGGTGALIILDHMLGRDWKKDSWVKAGMNWLNVHYNVWPGNTYYLYALERAGILYGTEKIGEHDWYKDGANGLLKAQQADGAWGKDTDWFNRTWDTCFSILFLRKAARPLVATEGGGKLKK